MIEYLKKHNITNKELLEKHIEELRCNTVVDEVFISNLSVFNLFSVNLTLNDKLKIANEFKQQAFKEMNVTGNNLNNQKSETFYASTDKVLEDFRNLLLDQDNNKVNLTDIADLITAKTEKKAFKVLYNIKNRQKEAKTEETLKDKLKKRDLLAGKLNRKVNEIEKRTKLTEYYKNIAYEQENMYKSIERKEKEDFNSYKNLILNDTTLPKSMFDLTNIFYARTIDDLKIILESIKNPKKEAKAKGLAEKFIDDACKAVDEGKSNPKPTFDCFNYDVPITTKEEVTIGDYEKLYNIYMKELSKLLEEEMQINPFIRFDYSDPDNPRISAKTNKTEEKVNRLVEEEIERQELEHYKSKILNNEGFTLDVYDKQLILSAYSKDDVDIILKNSVYSINLKNSSMTYLDEVLQHKNTTSTRHKSQLGETHVDYVNTGDVSQLSATQGIKASQKEIKAPIFTYCKVNKNALEKLALRAQYGHTKYNDNGQDEDWQNFTRVNNGDFEYANAEFRHALEIGEENEEGHLVSGAWNALARLEIYLRNKNK